jgi:hypothetical protein
MPWFKKLDNKGVPTGDRKHFSDRVAKRLMKIKNVKWRLDDTDKPLVSREIQVPVDVYINDFPKEVDEQLEWVKKQKDIIKLRAATVLTGKKTVKQAIEDRIEVLTAKNKKYE